ncbi:MAG: ankyrin repeat domain-containing protein [Dechloromonas sp.]|nr:ankyrin repeat domain-containing protein [Dechloromonas sp.]
MQASGKPTSALHNAIAQGSREAVIAALEAGADIEEVDVHGFSGLPLRSACFHGHIPIVLELLKRGADIHALNYEGVGAPIRTAVRARQPEIVRILLEHGADLPPGISLGLSHEEVFKAQLVATICQENRLDASSTATNPQADHQIREFFVSPEELEHLFGKPARSVNA